MSEELKPCPLCRGGEAVLDGKSDDCRCRCEGCGTLGPIFFFDGDDDEQIEIAETNAIAAWNRRQSDPEALELLRRAGKAFEGVSLLDADATMTEEEIRAYLAKQDTDAL